MAKGITYVGLDVHKASISVAMLSGEDSKAGAMGAPHRGRRDEKAGAQAPPRGW